MDKSPKHRNQTKGNQLDQVSHLGGFPASALSVAAASKHDDPEVCFHHCRLHAHLEYSLCLLSALYL